MCLPSHQRGGRDSGVPELCFSVTITNLVGSLSHERLCLKKSKGKGTEEMAQQLRTLPALPENLSSIPNTYVALHNHDSNSRGSVILFWLLQTLRASATQIQYSDTSNNTIKMLKEIRG